MSVDGNVENFQGFNQHFFQSSAFGNSVSPFHLVDVPIKNELKVNKNFSKSIEKDTKAGIRQFRNELR